MGCYRKVPYGCNAFVKDPPKTRWQYTVTVTSLPSKTKISNISLKETVLFLVNFGLSAKELLSELLLVLLNETFDESGGTTLERLQRLDRQLFRVGVDGRLF